MRGHEVTWIGGHIRVALGRQARDVGGACEDDHGNLKRSGKHVEREHGRRQDTDVAGGQAQLDRGCGAPLSMGGQYGVRGRHSSG